MKKAQLDKAFSEFIRADGERIETKKFFDILAEIGRRRVEKTIELKAKVVGAKLRFEPSPEISVHDNEIVVGNQRVVVQLK